MKITSVKNAIVKLELGTQRPLQDSLLEFGNGDVGLLRQSDEKTATAVLLKQSRINALRTSTSVKATTQKYSVSVSDKLLGLLLDSTGTPLVNLADGSPVTNFKVDSSFTTRLVDTNRVILTDRKEVNRPLRTGVFLVDTLIPIGRGQRELILGDKGTGKTWLGVQTIIQNRDDPRLRFIYCAIGKTSQEVNNVIAELRKANAVDKTIVVAAFLDDTDAAQYYSAYLATTIADHFREQGLDVFIVYDDLTKHGDAYRSLSIQTGQTPGREAFPGDIFYSHSRLLERSGAFVSGGTITSFPIVETIEENNASYLATNIISISDGQIMMSADKYNTNVLPAINYGPSVSRIGSSSQPYFIRQVKSYLIQLFSGYENNNHELKINVVNTNKLFLQNILNGYVLSAMFRQSPGQLLSFEHQWLLTVLVQRDCIMFLESVNEILDLRDELVNKVFKTDERILRVLNGLGLIKSKSDLQVCEELLISVIKPFISSYLRNKFADDTDKLKEILLHYEGYNYTLEEAARFGVKLKPGAEKPEKPGKPGKPGRPEKPDKPGRSDKTTRRGFKKTPPPPPPVRPASTTAPASPTPAPQVRANQPTPAPSAPSSVKPSEPSPFDRPTGPAVAPSSQPVPVRVSTPATVRPSAAVAPRRIQTPPPTRGLFGRKTKNPPRGK